MPPGAIALSDSLDFTAVDPLEGIDADVDTLLGILEAPAPAATANPGGAVSPQAYLLPHCISRQGAHFVALVRKCSFGLFGAAPETLPPPLHGLVAVLAAKGAHPPPMGMLPA